MKMAERGMKTCQGEGHASRLLVRHVLQRLIRSDALAKRRADGFMLRDAKGSQTKVTQIHFNFQPGSPGDAARSPPGFMENTENLAFLSSLVGGEPDAGLEEHAVLQVTSTEPEPAWTIGRHTGETEDSGQPLQVPQKPLRGGDVVTLASFTFVMKDTSYVAL
ncbi:hypothetical protein P7K49_013125 [Saguinus oedipus]|uniref:Uncharacterized protein n=1 Tax=Saguinus oedipus TaxID=9490 RepID=A0ABQ9VEZ8_SAGOE|nr:hypothetical protein P7K49_013125 [Saguinus oedipus]